MEQAGTKVGFSDPLIFIELVSDHKLSYDRDNRVITSKSSYRRCCLPPKTFGLRECKLASMNKLYAGNS